MKKLIIATLLLFTGCSDANFELGEPGLVVEDRDADALGIARDGGVGDEEVIVDSDAAPIVDSLVADTRPLGADTAPPVADTAPPVVDTAPAVDTRPVVDTALPPPMGETTTAAFPGPTSTSTCTSPCNYPGWYVHDQFLRASAVKKITFDVTVVDGTSCSGAKNMIAVKVGSVKVGDLAFFTSRAPGDPVKYLRFAGSFDVPGVVPDSGYIGVRFEALTGVCSGGGQWTFKSGGSVVME